MTVWEKRSEVEEDEDVGVVKITRSVVDEPEREEKWRIESEY